MADQPGFIPPPPPGTPIVHATTTDAAQPVVIPAAPVEIVGDAPTTTDSGTRRLPPRVAPQPPAAPPLIAPPAPASAEQPIVASVAPPADDDPETAPTSTVSAQLELPDGRRVPVAGPLVLGRNPSAPPAHPSAEAVAVHDPAKSVSKTHALVTPVRSGGVHVVDLDSTNGVTIGKDHPADVPETGAHVAAGGTFWLGSFPILVR